MCSLLKQNKTQLIKPGFQLASMGFVLIYQFALNHDILAFNKNELLSQPLVNANHERRIKLGVPGFDSIDL